MPDDPLDPLLDVDGIAAGLDVVVAQPHAQVLHVACAQAEDNRCLM